MWRRVFRFTLFGRNKLVFIIGTCMPEKYDHAFHHMWDRCNAVVLGWIMNSISKDLGCGFMYTENAFVVWKDLKERFDKVNRPRMDQLHMEIVLTYQGLDLISTFVFTKLRLLWVEYDGVCALPHIEGEDFKKHIEHKENQCLFQFLMGLKKNYSWVRSHLLLWNPLDSIN